MKSKELDMYVRDARSGAPLLAARDELDFFHQDRCLVPDGVTAFQSYCRMTNGSPLFLRLAFWLRDRFSALGGVRPIHGFARDRPKRTPLAGEKVDFFEVHRIYDEALFLVASDRHLSVLVALTLSAASATERELTITTSVRTHNFFGKLYMLPVAPAHGPIVRRMLQQLTCRS